MDERSAMGLTLREILAGLDGARLQGADAAADAASRITRVVCDSRQAGPGALFAALAGAKVDGRSYAAAAVEAGAGAVLSERAIPGLAVPQILHPEPRRIAAEIAARLQGDPSRALRLIGVTGTNGKTTVAYLLRHALRSLGQRVGMLGTIEYDDGRAAIPAPLTTPESVDFSAALARMVAAGAGWAVCEVSSHALVQHRVHPHRFACGIFTNLSRDHLDYHGDMKAYGAAKKRLFDGLDPEAAAVVNGDDPRHGTMVADCAAPVFRYGLGAGADLRATVLEAGLDGSRLRLEAPGHAPVETHVPLVGAYNGSNALAAIGTLLATEACPSLAAAAGALADFPGVPGRLERIAARGVTVFVDYAHTDDALHAALAVLRPLTPGTLRCVFGCGGDRDRGKRSLMARAAEAAADRVYATSDNPRSEDPERILDDLFAGFERPALHRRIVDRRAAVREAVADSAPGDVVLLAGKGHEDYQILPTGTIHLDDRELARAALGLDAKEERSACA